jgi:hypothetical protein
MPDYFQSQNPWLGAARAGQGLGDTIQSALLQVPKAQAEGRMMQQEFLMNQLKMQQEQQMAPFQTDLLRAQAGEATAKGKTSMAEAGMYDSEAALNRAKQGQLTTQDQLHVKLGQDMGNFVKEALTSGNVTPETASTLAQSLATINKLDPQLMPSIMKEVSMSASGIGKDPSLAASAMTGYKVPERTTVPAGSTSVETMNPRNQPFTAPGKAVDEDKNNTQIITALLAKGVEPSQVVKMAKQIKEQMSSTGSPLNGLSMDDKIKHYMNIFQSNDSNSPVAPQGGAPTNAPTPGQIEDGFRFKGGNPSDPNSWEQVTQ